MKVAQKRFEKKEASANKLCPFQKKKIFLIYV